MLPIFNSEVTQKNPMDVEDDGIQYFHTAYCSSHDGLSASLNHVLLFKVTAANVHVKRMARQMEYREVCVSTKCNSFREMSQG
jgi:hypothetical protein